MENFIIRQATKDDISLIYDFIKELAIYENLEDQVVATQELLHNWIFVEKKAEVLLAYSNDIPVGFALFFYNFSTFLGKAGIYLEDFYVREQYRGNGFGKAIFKKVASLALERGCGRLEWSCLDWNKPSIDFYLSTGAVPMDDWTVYRLSDEALTSYIK